MPHTFGVVHAGMGQQKLLFSVGVYHILSGLLESYVMSHIQKHRQRHHSLYHWIPLPWPLGLLHRCVSWEWERLGMRLLNVQGPLQNRPCPSTVFVSWGPAPREGVLGGITCPAHALRTWDNESNSVWSRGTCIPLPIFAWES